MEPVIKVVISRYWNNPMITVVISDEKIEVQMPVEDFLKAVVAEIPHPSITMTRSQLESQILKVLPAVLNKAKEATAQV
jgi:hypothetical protein